MLDIAYINRRTTVSKRDQVTVHRTPEQIAQGCLTEARNNPDKAIALARCRAHGRELRATIAAIGTAFLRGEGATDAR